jgi:hypothetical protein
MRIAPSMVAGVAAVLAALARVIAISWVRAP